METCICCGKQFDYEDIGILGICYWCVMGIPSPEESEEN